MKALYVLAHFLEYAKKKNWDGRPLWEVWLSQFVFWSFLLFLLMVFVVIPLIADLNTLSESKACAEKYGVKCEQRWVPISD